MSEPQSQSQSVPFSSWSEVYQRVRAKAEARRGTVTITPTDTPAVTYPNTSTRDAFAIAIVFDEAIDGHLSDALAERWTTETDLLAGEPDSAAVPFVGNRSLWDTLPAIAIELERANAPLPAESLVREALAALDETMPAEPEQLRNTPRAMLVTVFTEPTWKAMALRQLAFFRALRGEMTSSTPFLPDVPATLTHEVLALATYWTQQLTRVGASARDTYHRLVYSAWREVIRRVAEYAGQATPHERYPHNGEFWNALLLLATQSDVCHAVPMPWLHHAPNTHRHGPGDPYQYPRNAAPTDTPSPTGPIDTGATLEFPAATSFDEAARVQRDAFAKLRGEDTVTGRLIARVPRTTVSDVRQLAAFWSAQLAKVGEHNFADISYKHVVERWKAAIADVARIPATAEPGSVYEHNVDFWEALITIAIQVAVTAEAPSRWQLVKETAKKAWDEGAAGLWRTVLEHPFLAAGLGLGGVLVGALLTRGSSRK